MTAEEKFDSICSCIEELIENPKLSPAKIAEEASKSVYMNARELSSVFVFLTGRTLINYIKDRKMMSAYRFIVEEEVFDAQTAVEISGLGDQSSFTHKFTEIFNLAPKQAFEAKDYSLLESRFSWRSLTDTAEEKRAELNKEYSKLPQTVFGLEISKYYEVRELIDLQELYGFDEWQSRAAYNIHRMYGVDIRDVFEFMRFFDYDNYVDGYKKYIIDYPDASPIMSRNDYYDIYVMDQVRDPELRYVCFEAECMPPVYAQGVIEKLHDAGELDVTKLDIKLIQMSANKDISVWYAKKAVDYFNKNATDEYGEDAFSEYLEKILENASIEKAFSELIELDDMDDYSDYYQDDSEEDDLFFDSMEEARNEWNDEFADGEYNMSSDDYYCYSMNDSEDKYAWRDKRDDGAEYGIYPEDFDTEYEYADALDEAWENDC